MVLFAAYKKATHNDSAPLKAPLSGTAPLGHPPLLYFPLLSGACSSEPELSIVGLEQLRPIILHTVRERGRGRNR